MKPIFKQALALGLAAATLLPSAHAASYSSTNTGFYKELSRLIQSQDDSHYFGSMELTIGSNILTLDGVEERMDVAPDVQNNRTMLPIRAIAEAAGADVDYDAATQTVIITNPYGDEIRCPIGRSSMTLNSQLCALDAPAYARNGRTYLPVRAVAEALDLDVNWDQATSTVTLTAPYQTCRVLAWADDLDAGDLDAETVITDGTGLWVLQFSTPAQAREALQRLESDGVTVSPDLYIPPVDDAASSGASAQGEHYSWGVEDCHFDDFTDGRSFSGEGVVAVVDTGVDDSHSFLQGRVLSGRDFVDGDNDADDGHYHGTHVAGTILDCSGDAPVKILPVRVLNERGSGSSSTVVAGIKWAADQGADVINLSLGGSRGSSDVMDAGLDYAIQKGTLVVAAAGNDSSDTVNYCPAHVTTPGMVVASAGDSGHAKAYFTNYGESVDLMAPGVSVKSCAPGNTWKTLSGTSMAAPHASAAAVLLDLATGKSLTPAQLESKVRSATTGGTWTDKYMGCGFLDMSRADLPGGGTPAPSPEPDQPTIVAYEYSPASLSLKVGGSAGVKVYARYSDNTRKDVTVSCALTSSAPAVASVTGDGAVTALSQGRALISMTVAAPDGVTVPVPVTVDVTADAPADPQPGDSIVRYEWGCSDVTVAVGEKAQVSLCAVWSSGKKTDVTSKATLYVLDSSVATVSGGGTVSGLKTGSTLLSFQFAATDSVGVPAPLKVTVTEPAAKPDPVVYQKLSWVVSNTGNTSTSLTLSQGRSIQVDIYGETTDGRMIKLTGQCQPFTSDSSVCTISSSGKLTAVGPGTCYLWLKEIPNTQLTLPPLLEIQVK